MKLNLADGKHHMVASSTVSIKQIKQCKCQYQLLIFAYYYILSSTFRVLGAIAAAAANAMGRAAKQMGTQPVLLNSTASKVCDERERLMAHKNNSKLNKPNYAATSRTVPLSDSIWMLTDDELIESIRSSDPISPTTCTTLTIVSPNVGVAGTNFDDDVVEDPPKGYARGNSSSIGSSHHEALPRPSSGRAKVVQKQMSIHSSVASGDIPMTIFKQGQTNEALDLDEENEDYFEEAISPSWMIGSQDEPPRLLAFRTGGVVSLDEMTLPEPEPWVGDSAVQKVPPQRQPPHRTTSNPNVLNQASTSGQVPSGGRGKPLTRGSVRGRGVGRGRGSMTSLIAYSNMSKKKGGFLFSSSGASQS